MLQISTNNSFDIPLISELLVEHIVTASISAHQITLAGEISVELLRSICDEISINSVQNWPNETAPISDDKTETLTPATENTPDNTKEYDLKYPSVHRGEVYFCDFGKPFYHEKGFIRPAIVVQSDSISSPQKTIVLPCTSHGKTVSTDLAGWEKHITLEPDVDFSQKNSIVKVAEIRSVDKRRLRKRIGTMTPEFMDKIQGIIDITLDLTKSLRRTNTIKKITFNVTPQLRGSLAELLREVSEFSCRINLNFKAGTITVEQTTNNMLKAVIKLVCKYFDLLGVNIDNYANDALPVVVTSHAAELSTTSSDKFVPKVVSHNKVEFEKENINSLLNKLLRTVDWAMDQQGASKKEISWFLYTTMGEISMRYRDKEADIDFLIGDIVDCNFGQHLPGEINGGHVPSIVCNISDYGMAYCVPIVMSEPESSSSFVEIHAINDITYSTKEFSSGFVLLDKGRYVCPSRFKEVIGKVRTSFFITVLSKLATTFSFIPPVDNAEAVTKSHTKNKKIENILREYLGTYLNSLDTKQFENQITPFLESIGMETDNPLLYQAFLAACSVQKVTFDTILESIPSELSKDQIKAKLKKTFKKWLDKNPQLAEKSSRLSIVELLKLFAKQFN